MHGGSFASESAPTRSRLPEFWRLPDFRQPVNLAPKQVRHEKRARSMKQAQPCTRRRGANCNRDAFAARRPGTPFAVGALMRAHHEAATSAIVSALAMVIPVASALWARATALQRGAPPAKTTREAGDEREV
jgi:hypothetical protein